VYGQRRVEGWVEWSAVGDGGKGRDGDEGKAGVKKGWMES
jgi:hypothetical protein